MLFQSCQYYVDQIFKCKQFQNIDPPSKDNLDSMLIQRLGPAGYTPLYHNAYAHEILYSKINKLSALI